MRQTDVVVLGAGAAGLMCAAVAGARGRSVIVLERNERIGEKIRISGGGRCNFTNTGAKPVNFLSSNPHFAKSALARFKPADFIAMVERHGIAYHEKTLGQLFCDGSSREIIALLEEECAAAGVTIVASCEVDEVMKSGDGGFLVSTPDDEYQCFSLVVATGGLSIPPLGATDFGYRLASQFRIPIVPPKPGLVPLTLAGEDLELASGLSGVSLDAAVSCGGATFRENILFTHRGLSGPAILQASSYWNPGEPVTIDLCPRTDLRDFLGTKRNQGVHLDIALPELFPRSFIKAWYPRIKPTEPLPRMSNAEIERIAGGLHGWTVVPSGTEGYAKAEVTCGGVDTAGLSSKTMEAKGVPGLYFIGEVVDVTGWLGGYNFQWAWASGFAAGSYA